MKTRSRHETTLPSKGRRGGWEIQRTKTSALYETEGIAFASALNGTLHWQVQPRIPL